MRSGLPLILCVFGLLAGCGGGDGGSTPPPTSNNPPPAPPPPPPPVIGASGGTVTESGGASVVVPAGALSADATIRIAKDSTGAPAIPAELNTSGNMYVITPHGGDFAVPIKVRIPAPTVPLQPNQEFKLAKAQPGGEWAVLADTELDAGVLSVDVDSFSFFVPVIITYILPIVEAVPYQAFARLECSERACNRALGTVTANYRVTTNSGQLPVGCTHSNARLQVYWGNSVSYTSLGSNSANISIDGGTIIREVPQTAINRFEFGVARYCSGIQLRYTNQEKAIEWVRPPSYPNLKIVNSLAVLDIVEGMPASLGVVFAGGASNSGDQFNAVTDFNRTIIDWERSDNGGASWRVVSRSYENEGNPWPYTAHQPWYYWSVRHAFVGTIADQGALIRAHACYTPPSQFATPPCVTTAPTRLNVLQQSASPTIVDAPRSVLVRTGQTASFSVTASGLPAPTLIWQTRVANSTGAWTDLTGPGANTANYTTPAMALSDNGVQYRVLATNTMGSTASAVVSVSVSDLDVAPSISTQPASLSLASGGDAVFAVDARGTEALSYQWYRNGSALAGANNPVLRLTGVSILNSGSFSVKVSNAAGNVDSNAAVLNVYAGTPAAVAPTIVTQPASLNVNVGNTATFAVGVDGSGPFTFQWRRNGINIPGTNSAVLSLTSVVPDASGEYSVVVSNSASPGVTSSSASLSVSDVSGPGTLPAITTQPATLIVAPGGAGLLAVGATGSGPLEYLWLNDGIPMQGETEPVLTFANADDVAGGRYSVHVSNSLGYVVSTEVQVIILGAPFITQSPVSRTVVDGDTTQFSVIAGGSHLRYQWLRNGLAIPGATLSYYNAPPVYVADSGAVYSVIVSNGAGIEVSAPAVLTVIAFVAPSVVAHPVNASVVAGTAAPLCATFGGSPPFEVQMTRWSGTAWLPVLAARRIDDNLPACTTTPVLQLADNGAQFRFEAIAGPGQAYSTTTNPATITVTAPSVITTTMLASRATNGATANNRSGFPSLSADGNIVAFMSEGTNLVPGFGGYPLASSNAYVRNMTTGVTTLINQTPAGTQSQSPYGVNEIKVAADGRHVIFTSVAGDLVADDTNGSEDVFVRDLQTGITRRASLRANGTETEPAGNGVSSMQVDISADGRFVSFMSSHDYIGNGPDGDHTLYFRDLQGGVVKRIASTNAAGTVGHSALSADGEHLVYLYATFTPGDTRNTVIHYDTEADSSEILFSIDSTNFASFVAEGMAISGNGRYVTFPVRSPTMFNGNAFTQVLAIDRNNMNHITIASGDSNGFGNEHSLYPRVSDDGHVAFMSYAGNLTGNFANSQTVALVVRDLQSSELKVASRRPNGTNIAILYGYTFYAISRDGTAVAFAADELDMSGGAHEAQVYVAPRP